eukprot:5299900-Pleurochrysis_carterae.AAC.5
MSSSLPTHRRMGARPLGSGGQSQNSGPGDSRHSARAPLVAAPGVSKDEDIRRGRGDCAGHNNSSASGQTRYRQCAQSARLKSSRLRTWLLPKMFLRCGWCG